MDEQQLARRLATWLPRLAEPADVAAAAEALFQISLDAVRDEPEDRGKSRADLDTENLRLYGRALDLLGADTERLIPRWIDRFLELLRAQQARQEQVEASIRAHRDMPPLDMAGILAVNELVKVLGSAGRRLDPHLRPLADAVGTLGRDGDEHACAVLKRAGPAVTAAVPGMLDVLRRRGVWCWPSHHTQALARASAFDDRVLPALREMLSSEDKHLRESAIQALGALGPRARPAAAQLLAFRGRSEGEVVSAIHALAQLGEPTPQVLDLLEWAMRQDDGYVRRAAARELGALRPEPGRFVPLLIENCDQFPDLHDEGLPEACVRALGEYGAAARGALPRLNLFLAGPVKGRTVRAPVVLEAIGRIGSGEEDAPARKAPARRTGPVADDEPLFAVPHEGRQCYIDRSGRIVISTPYEYGKPFSDGRAIVHEDGGGMFVIDRAGAVVFESTWDDIKPFSEGLAAVQREKKWGFVDKGGRVVIELQYDSVTHFSEGLAGVERGRTSESLGPIISRTVPGRQGCIDRSGKVVIPIEWHGLSTFHEGRAAACTGGVMKYNMIAEREVLSDLRFGYIDRAGSLVIPDRYALASPFREGLAAVYAAPAGRDRAGYLDKSGAVAIPLEFTSAGWFSDGLALVQRRGKLRRGRHYLIDRAGNVLRELTYRMVEPFSEGLAAAWEGEAFGFIDVTGRMVIPPQFDQCERFKDGLAEVQRGDWYGLIDRTGKFVWGPTTEGAVSRVFESEWY